MTIDARTIQGRNGFAQSMKIYYGAASVVVPTLTSPAWLGATASNDTTNKIITFNINPSQTGEGSFSFSAFVLYYVVIQTPYILDDDCCGDDDVINIAWVNAHGGWQNWYFNKIQEFNVENSGAQSYINSSRITRYSDAGDVRYGVLVRYETFNNEIIDQLESLKYAVQAYDFTTGREIVINKSSFSKYDNLQSNAKKEFEFTFVYGEKITNIKQ